MHRVGCLRIRWSMEVRRDDRTPLGDQALLTHQGPEALVRRRVKATEMEAPERLAGTRS